jgi:predicted RNase H-like nuclease (RuvC/YqgF family)
MIESIVQGLAIFFYWVGIILCVLAAYMIPVWGLTRYERAQLRRQQTAIEVSKTEFAQQMQSQETFNKAQNCMHSAYQKQTDAIRAYTAALTAIEQAEAIRQQAEIKMEKVEEKNKQLRGELENSRERTKRLAKKLQNLENKNVFTA